MNEVKKTTCQLRHRKTGSDFESAYLFDGPRELELTQPSSKSPSWK